VVLALLDAFDGGRTMSNEPDFSTTSGGLAIPAKKITHSDAMSIRVGAKRRWPAFMLV
jgi:hypothetical protein